MREGRAPHLTPKAYPPSHATCNNHSQNSKPKPSLKGLAQRQVVRLIYDVCRRTWGRRKPPYLGMCRGRKGYHVMADWERDGVRGGEMNQSASSGSTMGPRKIKGRRREQREKREERREKREERREKSPPRALTVAIAAGLLPAPIRAADGDPDLAGKQLGGDILDVLVQCRDLWHRMGQPLSGVGLVSCKLKGNPPKTVVLDWTGLFFWTDLFFRGGGINCVEAGRGAGCLRPRDLTSALGIRSWMSSKYVSPICIISVMLSLYLARSSRVLQPASTLMEEAF